MDIGCAILIIGCAALVAAFLLLVIGLVYSELMNSHIPPGVENTGKLHTVHSLFVGTAIVGRILHRLGFCHQVTFIRWFVSCFLTHTKPPPPDLRIKDLLFSGVLVRIYEPTTASDGARRGLVYFHGGGWVLGSIDTVDEVCRYIALKSNTTVVSVGYRLAPEHKYPSQLDDCEAATRHFLTVAMEDFGVDPGRVAVGGDSTGANLAAALCQRLAKQDNGHLVLPCAQVLVYPVLQMADFNLPSYQQNHAVPILFRARMAFYFLQYLNEDPSLGQDLLDGYHVPNELKPRYRSWLSPSNLPPECLSRGYSEPPKAAYDGGLYHTVKDGLEHEVSPLLAEDDVIDKAPPTFILTCEYDVVRDDGILFRKRLLDLNKEVTWKHMANGFHGMVNFYNQNWLGFPAATQEPGECTGSIYSGGTPCSDGPGFLSLFVRMYHTTTPQDKWSQPGWKIERKYTNKVLLGNWAEERLQFNQERHLPTAQSSTSRADYRPHWDVKSHSFERESGLLRAEGLPAKLLFAQQGSPCSDGLVTHYEESYGRKGTNALPTLQPCHQNNSTWPLQRPNTAFPIYSGSQQLQKAHVDRLESHVPSQTVYRSTYQQHPVSALCQGRLPGPHTGPLATSTGSTTSTRTWT
ncbi:hypothetical protein WMY93_013638 [Mugilogobius chulae]|uniref:Alpha/beta hydrolase fold-3 domain-containing protein n=1 Tax=Mugilogobius chulae TaxID=88201 RepID=A0AAW0P9Q2_9GOBI